MKEIGVSGANERRRTLAGNYLGKHFFEENIWGDILSGQDNVLVKDG